MSAGTISIIGVIGAMQEEIDMLLERLQDKKTRQHAGIAYHQGTLHNREIIVCKSGVGKVNAAVCTQVLIDRFKVDAVIFTGVAGALAPELEIGDIVISDSCMQHDMDVTALGFARGVIPYQEVSDFPSDSRLIQLARQAGERVFPGRCHTGKVLSGDQFIAGSERVKQLHGELGGSCVEMEGASVAQVCHMNGVPHVIIRSMSDKADGSAPDNFAAFTLEASRRSFAIVDDMIRSLPA